jgi:RNA polymerase sigma-70 factor, ECF subfamily
MSASNGEPAWLLYGHWGMQRDMLPMTKSMVTPLTFARGDDDLIDALRAGHPGAAAVFYDRYASSVHRTLQSVLGRDAEIPDLLQDVFIRAIDRISELEHLDQVRSWLTTIAVFTARAHIRRQTRRKWLFLFSPDQTKQNHLEPPSSDARRALRETYKTLDTLPANERIAFVLRIIEGMTLPEAAEAAGTSLATFKRRLSRAEKKFLDRVRERPLLQQWLQEGTRWTLERQK